MSCATGVSPVIVAESTTGELQDMEALLKSFRAHNLDGVGKLALLDRFDTKYLVPSELLPTIMAALQADYTVLEIDGNRLMQYETVYFDTSEFRYYRQHHSRKKTRAKIRCRTYVDSGDSFLEVKRKNNKNMTEKTRIPAASNDPLHDALNLGFFQNELESSAMADLKDRVIVGYRRVSMQSLRYGERVSIDLGLEAERVDGESRFKLNNLAVVELKQGRVNRDSQLYKTMRALGLRPVSISKYCVACALLYSSDLKFNSFKEIIGRLKPFISNEVGVLNNA